MSVHTWGESPHGQWLLEIRNEGRYMGEFEFISIVLGRMLHHNVIDSIQNQCLN